MYSGWDDDLDINNISSDELYKDIPTAPSSIQYQAMPPAVKKMEPVVKDTFEDKSPVVEFSPYDHTDGHPIGSQPKINILRSADRETYCDKKAQLTAEWIYFILMAIAFFIMVVLYMNLRSQLCSTKATFDMLMRLYCIKAQEK